MPPATPKSTHFLYHGGNRGKDSLPSFPQAPILLGQFGHLRRLFWGLFGVAFVFTLFITKSILLQPMKDAFRNAGYGLTEIVLDASYCGVPQSRKRYFLIGCIGAEEDFLQTYLVEKLSDKPMTMRDYFGDSLGVDYYFRVPRSYNRRGVFSIDEPCQTIRGVDRPVPPGYSTHPSDPVEIGPKVRALTVLERSYVQTFPKTFQFFGCKTDLNQMIGNAVPVKLAEFVANAIIKFNNQA